MVIKCRLGVAVCVVALSSGAYGQTSIYDCLTDYVDAGVASQTGLGLNQSVFQPMPIQTEPYTVTHITAIIEGQDANGAMDELDFIGRTLTVEFFFGEFDDVNDVFVEDTSLPRPPAMDVVLTAEMLSEAAEDPVNKELLDIDVTVPVITGKQLHIGLIAEFSLDAGEVFFVPESNSCTGQESAWWSSFDGQSTLQGRVGEIAGFDTGMNAMRVEVQLGIAVPTVSEWGLVAMTLLMMTVGTLACRSHMAKPVAVRDRNGGWGAG